jgi:hypothetical protein
VKVKNPKAPAVKREAEEDWGRQMRGPISEAVVVAIIGFVIGGIAGAIIHFTFDNGNTIVPHPASYSKH